MIWCLSIHTHIYIYTHIRIRSIHKYMKCPGTSMLRSSGPPDLVFPSHLAQKADSMRPMGLRDV